MESVTFILIPGAGGSAWYWHLVAPKLQERGHEAIPVELPAADDRAGLPHMLMPTLAPLAIAIPNAWSWWRNRSPASRHLSCANSCEWRCSCWSTR